MEEISTVGIDLAKSVFQVHAICGTGNVIVRRQLRRQQMLKFFEQLPPCLIGMEACGTAHYGSVANFRTEAGGLLFDGFQAAIALNCSFSVAAGLKATRPCRLRIM